MLSISAFEQPCTSYHGPHSLGCLEKVWTNAGCLLDSDYAPQKLTAIDFNAMTALNIE